MYAEAAHQVLADVEIRNGEVLQQFPHNLPGIGPVAHREEQVQRTFADAANQNMGRGGRLPVNTGSVCVCVCFKRGGRGVA